MRRPYFSFLVLTWIWKSGLIGAQFAIASLNIWAATIVASPPAVDVSITVYGPASSLAACGCYQPS
jgi:hypothetical protein